MKLTNKTNIFLLIISAIYLVLGILSLNNCYFWDNIQQTSKEAHWFYMNGFKSLIMPTMDSGKEIVATGYHPPLMGIMTAILWQVFGYKIWVSHVFMFFWAIILFYNLLKIIKLFVSEKYVGWAMLIILLEPTILTQFSIASPDFILFTAFVLSLRAIFERKPVLLAVGVFFLFGINMRGVFAGLFVMLVHIYQVFDSEKKINFRSFYNTILPYLPTFIILALYFIYYFSVNGWFFAKSTSTDHYSLPNSPFRILKHLAEFGLRNIENGRLLIWITGIYIISKTIISKQIVSKNEKFIFQLFSLLFGLYLLFVFISNMPFSARYFTPLFFLLTLISLIGITKFFDERKKILFFVLILCFELTGNLWIYPEKIAKPWDSTLAHLSFYELRKQCFNYIDKENIDYKDVSAGFCLDGNRRFSELIKEDKRVGIKTNNQYFIYSNISNVEDSLAIDLKNPQHWNEIKHFEKNFVFITIYKRVSEFK
jgi:4-amino-4-deoxy-L-arabinose transferase-like glycosyltransferase